MKKSISKKIIVYPHPAFVIGTYDKDRKPDIMLAAWSGICSSEPPCIGISIRKSRLTYDNLMINKSFTVNIPSIDFVRETDYAGIVSGKNVDKFKELKLTPIDGEVVNAPYIKEFPMALLCRVLAVNDLGSHTQFIGEIIDSIADEEVLDEKGLPDIEKVKPFCFDSSDVTYYAMGKKIMNAYTTKKI